MDPQELEFKALTMKDDYQMVDDGGYKSNPLDPPGPPLSWALGAVQGESAVGIVKNLKGKGSELPTSPRSTGFCAIWECISSSSSSVFRWGSLFRTTWIKKLYIRY